MGFDSPQDYKTIWELRFTNYDFVEMNASGKYIIIAGLIIVVIGVIVLLFGNKLSFIGKLPGDIHVKRENFSFYFPITTMILLSILISGILWFVRRIS